MQGQLDDLAFRLVVGPGVAPAATVAVLFRRHDSWVCVTGSAGVRSLAQPQPVTAESPFDLASVSKPFVAAALARLAQAGRLDLQAPLGALLGEAHAGASSTCSLELLLSHRAGLFAHRTLYAPLLEGRAFDRGQALTIAANARRSECSGQPPTAGFPPLYSDLGYILAGDAAERLLGRPLDELVFDEVCDPLGLTLGSARQRLHRSSSFLGEVVPTEHVPWRGGELVGAVHDDNAWALAGHGLSGQAGLFGSAEAVARFGAAILDALAGRNRAWLGQSSAEWLVSGRPGGTLRAGFDGKAHTASSAGERCGPRTFGHLGFTGTSLWCDPDADVAAALLSNRVNLKREREGPTIRDVRPQVHDLLFDLAERWKKAPGAEVLETAGKECKISANVKRRGPAS